MKTNYAAMAYLSYWQHTGGVSLATGQSLPEWHELRPEIQNAWHAAAAAVETHVLLDAEARRIAREVS
jgi:hypothetical protein